VRPVDSTGLRELFMRCPRIFAQWASFVLLSIFIVCELCRLAAHGRCFFWSGDNDGILSLPPGKWPGISGANIR
jgi:hypothetical protein